MRPDEHKKRKNAQYKKKHGISTTEINSEKKDKGRSAAGKSSDKGKAEGASKKREVKTISSQQEPKPKNEESDEESQIFKRRNLVSNWSRYDLPIDDDSDSLPLQRGEDFNKLLASAGGSSAQFRFRDEEDWEDTFDYSSSTTNVLAINLEDLQQSLSCLPLHQRLEIAEDLFSGNQLQDIVKTAATNETTRLEDTYSKGVISAINWESNSYSKGGNTDKTSVSNGNKKRTVDMADRSHDRNTAADTAQQTDLLKDTSSCDDKARSFSTAASSASSLTDKMIKELKKVPSQSKTNIVISDDSKTTHVLKDDTSSLEEDLDMLLSLEGQNSAVNSDSGKKCEAQDSQKISNKIMSEHNTSNDTPSTVPPASNSKNNNLEDWLDSMLDD